MMNQKSEQTLKELDSIFRSRERTIEVLLQTFLECVLPAEVGDLTLEKADTLPKLCDMFVAYRKAMKDASAKSLRRIAGIVDDLPTKLSDKAMKHLAKFGLVRSDFPDNVVEAEVFEIRDEWDAGHIKLERWVSEANIEDMAPVAKKRIRLLGGSRKDLSVIDDCVERAGTDDVWRYPAAQLIAGFTLYCEIRVAEGRLVPPPDKALIDCSHVQAGVRVQAYIDRRVIRQKHLEQVKETAKRLRERLKAQGKLNSTERFTLLTAEDLRDRILKEWAGYDRNLNERLKLVAAGKKSKSAKKKTTKRSVGKAK